MTGWLLITSAVLPCASLGRCAVVTLMISVDYGGCS